MIIRTLIPCDANFTDGGLTTFLNSNLDVDGIVLYVLLNRDHLREEVTVIQVNRRYIVAVRIEAYAFVQVLAIVDIASIDFQDALEDRRIVLCVSNESDVPKVELTSFFYSDFNIYKLTVESIRGI